MTARSAVVDLYAKVWGPCEMLANHFQNFFFDYGEKLSMVFVRAERDKVLASTGAPVASPPQKVSDPRRSAHTAPCLLVIAEDAGTRRIQPRAVAAAVPLLSGAFD